jgi:hypothetical protein
MLGRRGFDGAFRSSALASPAVAAETTWRQRRLMARSEPRLPQFFARRRHSHPRTGRIAPGVDRLLLQRWPSMVTALDDRSANRVVAGRRVAPSRSLRAEDEPAVYLVRPTARTCGGSPMAAGRTTGSEGGAPKGVADVRPTARPPRPWTPTSATSRRGPFARREEPGSYLDLSRDDQFAVLYRQKTRGGNDLFLVEMTGRRNALDAPRSSGQFGSAVFSPKWTNDLPDERALDRTAFARVKLSGGGTGRGARRASAEPGRAHPRRHDRGALVELSPGGRLSFSTSFPGRNSRTDSGGDPSGCVLERQARLAFTASGLAASNLGAEPAGMVQVTDSPHRESTSRISSSEPCATPHDKPGSRLALS